MLDLFFSHTSLTSLAQKVIPQYQPSAPLLIQILSLSDLSLCHTQVALYICSMHLTPLSTS